MACDVAAFKSAFPELDFGNTPQASDAQKIAATALITVHVNAAVATVDRTMFATAAKADLATLYLAAHLMAASPSGLAMHLAASDFSGTLYGTQYRTLAAAAAVGGLVP